MQNVVIVQSYRSAVAKAPRGLLKDTRPDDMSVQVIKALLQKVPQLDPAQIDDIVLGTAFPEGEQGMNMARIVAMQAGLPKCVPGLTINRFCSSGLNAISMAADRIFTGQADVVLAGGAESMSMVPMGGSAFSPSYEATLQDWSVYMGMGHTAEYVANKYGVTRAEQDAFAVRSHQNAAQAIAKGLFKDEIVPLQAVAYGKDAQNRPIIKRFTFDTDEGVRADTSLETLQKLKPAFNVKGSVTAGNSSQTSDGAAFTLLMSEAKAKALGIKPLAYFRGFTVVGCDQKEMGIGPVFAIPRLLQKHGLKISDIDLFEVNEAFASQSVYIQKKLEIPLEKLNVNGGAIALGHPLGCTGAKLTATLLRELDRRKARYGVISMCIGGGMGAAGLIERY